MKIGVELDTRLYDYLKPQYFLVELRSEIQRIRKGAGLKIGEIVDLRLENGKLNFPMKKMIEEMIKIEKLASRLNNEPMKFPIVFDISKKVMKDIEAYCSIKCKFKPFKIIIELIK